MPDTKRTRRHGEQAKGEFRLALIETAKDLLMQDGIEAVSIRNITKRVGMTPMAFYRYFDTKVDVVQCIWEHTFAGLLGALVTRMSAQQMARSRLQALVEAYLDFWSEHPDEARAIFFGDGSTGKSLSVEVNFLDNPAAQPVLNLWEQCIGACLPRTAARVERSRLLRDAMFWQLTGALLGVVLVGAGRRAAGPALREICVKSAVASIG